MTASDPVPYSKIAVVDAARVYNSANISIPNNTATALTFNSERYDTNGLHSTVSNTGRLTAQTTGLYLAWANVEFAAFQIGAGSYCMVNLRLNGATTIASHRTAPLDSITTRVAVSTPYSLSATDYVEVVVQQVSGGALNAVAASNYSPEFGMAYIGRIA